MKSINTWGFYFLPPFTFVILPVTSGQAAKIGVESRKCLTMSLTYQEAAVKLELCVIQGELGGPEACERGGFSLPVAVVMAVAVGAARGR